MRSVPKRALVVILLLGAVVGALIGYSFRSSHTRAAVEPAVASAPAGGAQAHLPRPAHVVIVIEENKSLSRIIGVPREAPYLNELAGRAAVFMQSYGVVHPSQPNYFALFAGVTNSNGDACDVAGIANDAPNLGAQLLAAHDSFVGYAEGLPAGGDRRCSAGDYARKHAPWTHFSNIPAASIAPLSAFPRDYTRLPTVAFVIPDLQDDMHSASVGHGDAWLRRFLTPLAAWAAQNDTLVIVTWDESSAALTNHIPTLFLGPMVRPGRYDGVINHYRVLRTLEDMYGLPHAGHAADVAPIDAVWRVRGG